MIINRFQLFVGIQKHIRSLVLIKYWLYANKINMFQDQSKCSALGNKSPNPTYVNGDCIYSLKMVLGDLVALKDKKKHTLISWKPMNQLASNKLKKRDGE